MPRCKQGDWALVVRSKCGNAGRVVRVLAPSAGNDVPFGSRYFEADGSNWSKNTEGFTWWCVAKQGKLNRILKSGRILENYSPTRPFRDRDLIPLRPDTSPEAKQEMIDLALQLPKENA